MNYIKTQLMSAGLKMAVHEMFNERCSFIVGSEMPGIGFYTKQPRNLQFLQ